VHEYKTCDICWAKVDPDHLMDHKEWHKTMRNIPKEVQT
jgi:hypothetical protein